jgi:hypothetical protein
MTVYNNSGSKGTVTVACTGTWTCTGPGTVVVANGAAGAFDVDVTIPGGAAPGDDSVNNVEVSISTYTDDMDITTTSIGAWNSCNLPAGADIYWGMGFDGTDLWMSNIGSAQNHSFDPSDCSSTGLTCNPATCSAGASFYGMTVYNNSDPTDCSCGTTYAALAVSERGLAYRASSDSFFYGGWNTTTITEMAAVGGATLNTLNIGHRFLRQSQLRGRPRNGRRHRVVWRPAWRW